MKSPEFLSQVASSQQADLSQKSVTTEAVQESPGDATVNSSQQATTEPEGGKPSH